ncbi:hypothetical protein DL96DRAFT_328876 [Flagelloscypha sp. PMI_526]|nr:hypothetical protein DL96DRAFT_328876 [Flagelloscypha sp. PMI_526]
MMLSFRDHHQFGTRKTSTRLRRRSTEFSVRSGAVITCLFLLMTLSSLLQVLKRKDYFIFYASSPFSSYFRFICLLNKNSAEGARLLRTYRVRSNRGPQCCTIRQAFHATLADQIHSPGISIGEPGAEEIFITGHMRYNNPTQQLVREIGNAFSLDDDISCVVSLGPGIPALLALSGAENYDELDTIVKDSNAIAAVYEAQFKDIGSFFYRFSLERGVQEGANGPKDKEELGRHILASVHAYLADDIVSERVDKLIDATVDRPRIVSARRLKPLAASNGRFRFNAFVDKVEIEPEELNTKTLTQAIHEWLTPIDQSAKLDRIVDDRREGTCNWFLKCSTFVSWKEAQNSLFWFYGHMGAGKTYVTSVAIDHVTNLTPSPYVAYYYFDFSHPITLSFTMLLRTLVRQLMKLDPLHLQGLYAASENGLKKLRIEELKTALQHLLSSSSSSPPVYIVVDGIDECPENERKHVISFLASLAVHAKVMLTSRDQQDVRDALEGYVQFSYDILQGDGGKAREAVKKDIDKYIEGQLDTRKWKNWPKEECMHIRKFVGKKAEGVFRVAACIVSTIHKVETQGQLYKALNAFPDTLHDIYDHILENVIPQTNRHLALIILRTLTFAMRPLKAHEIVDLLACADGEDKFESGNRFIDPTHILTFASPFIATVFTSPFLLRPIPSPFGLDEFSIQLAHSSAKEHLLSTVWSQQERWYSQVNERLAHDMIARGCLSRLLAPPKETKNFDIQGGPPSYWYFFWWRHANLALDRAGTDSESAKHSQPLLKQSLRLFKSTDVEYPTMRQGSWKYCKSKDFDVSAVLTNSPPPMEATTSLEVGTHLFNTVLETAFENLDGVIEELKAKDNNAKVAIAWFGEEHEPIAVGWEVLNNEEQVTTELAIKDGNSTNPFLPVQELLPEKVEEIKPKGYGKLEFLI